MNEEYKSHYDVLIVGSGPAGLTAAIYASRANLSVLVLEGRQPGGQLTITTEVENYPGFEDGIQGPELMDVFRKQAQRFGAQTLFREVTEVSSEGPPFTIKAEDLSFTANAVVVSTGASAKMLGIESEKMLMGYGVSACATCDAFFFKNREVAVVGGGDSAMEEANYLTKFASKVTLIHRRDKFRASKIMQDRLLENPKIEVKYDTTIDEILGNKTDGVKGLKLRNTVDGSTSEMNVDGVFMAIGHKPNSDLFKDFLETNEAGYIVTKPDSTYTSKEGIFACGDVQDWTYRQAITAAGSGCKAAIDAERWLEAKGLVH